MKLVTCLNIVLLVEYVISRCPPNDYYPIPSFGENCRYRCHCAADVQCHNVTGDCPGPCARGWMGPACQYRNVALNATNVIQNGVNVNPEAVNDGNLTTCSDLRPSDNSNEYFWRIELSRPFYIVGIIVHTLSGAQSTTVRIETADVMNFSIGKKTCVRSFTIVENGTTEVICRQPVVARALQFVNQGNRSTMSLCELEIYGGRHVSFNKNTTQVSTVYYDKMYWYSRSAVDGTGAWNNSHVLTCSATEKGWWQLNLGTTYRIEDVYIFSRRNDPSLTSGFTLTIGENSTYQDTPTNSPSDYLPWTLDLEQPVAGNTVKLNRSGILTLCEVIVYAECMPGWCGWECNDVCMCNTPHTGSPRLGAVCSFGCQDGWSGTNGRCDKVCNEGWLGQNCSVKCENCHGGAVNCDRVTGVCSKGCLPGYNNSFVTCVQACNEGWFGHNCSAKCGNCQGGGVNCNHVTGMCSKGCQPGYNNSDATCVQECNDGWFGQNCSAQCGNCQDGGVNCNHRTGVCSKGCLPGYNSSDVTCVQACKSGWFGQNCSANCGNCRDDGRNCNHVTGVCSKGCLPGYNNSDATCVQECNDGWFGQNCSSKCGHCQDGGVNCNHRTGVCSKGCLPGYNSSDVTCWLACSPGWFDQNCSAECGNCQGGGANCDHVSGVCIEGCLLGYNHSDLTCMTAVRCPFHTYGRDCTPCGPCKNGLCDPISGECPFGCYDGYVGNRCETIITNTEVTVGTGIGVGVASTLLVVGIIVAVFWAKKRRNHIYEEPNVRLTREQAEESAYASIQDQGNQSVDISGKIQEYENTMSM